MLVTLSGMVMEVSSVQPENAPLPILVTEPSDGMTLFLQPKINVFLPVSIRQFPLLWYFVLSLSTVILVRPVHPENA